MMIFCTYVRVRPDYKENFIQACIKNRKSTHQELGNLRFDLLQDESDPTDFMLFEVYRSREAMLAHRETNHYREWYSTVMPWMIGSRAKVSYIPIAPTSEEEW